MDGGIVRVRAIVGGMHPWLVPLVPPSGSNICIVSCSVWKQMRRSSSWGLVVGGSGTNAKEDSSRIEVVSLCSIDPPACSLSPECERIGTGVEKGS